MVDLNMLVLMIVIAVISIAWYFTNKGEHAMLFKINKIVFIKPQKHI